MTRFPKVSRAVVAALLAVSVVAVASGPSGAAPLPTGSVVADGNGGVTVTYDGEPQFWYLAIFEAGAPCPIGTGESPGSSGVFSTATYAVGGAFGPYAGQTSVTLDEGSEVGVVATLEFVPFPAGTYQFCLVTLVGNGIGFVSVSEVQAEIAAPTTTTTTAAPTTTTEPAVVPAAPRFTG